MKKLISIILVIVLAITLSGCGEESVEFLAGDYEEYVDGAVNLQYDEANDNWFLCVRTDEGTNLDCDIIYTQEEVDEMLSNVDLSFGYGADGSISICIDFDENNAVMGDCIRLESEYLKDVLDYYTKDELDEGFEDALIYIQDLEQRIIELESGNTIDVYSNCNIDLMYEHLVVYLYEFTQEDNNYTFLIDEDGSILEFYNGEYNETITKEDWIEDYCTIENGGE